jgi:hypothetical protein
VAVQDRRAIRPEGVANPDHDRRNDQADDDPGPGEARWFTELTRAELARVLLVRRQMASHFETL